MIFSLISADSSSNFDILVCFALICCLMHLWLISMHPCRVLYTCSTNASIQHHLLFFSALISSSRSSALPSSGNCLVSLPYIAACNKETLISSGIAFFSDARVSANYSKSATRECQLIVLNQRHES